MESEEIDTGGWKGDNSGGKTFGKTKANSNLGAVNELVYRFENTTGAEGVYC